MKSFFKNPYILIIIWLMSSPSMAQNLNERSTVIIEQQLHKFRVTILMARDHFSSVSNSVDKTDKEVLKKIFMESIEDSKIHLGSKPCDWGLPSGHLSPQAIYLQANAFCMYESPSSHISWDMKFLRGLPKNHPIYVNLLIRDKVEQHVLYSTNTRLSYHPVPVNEAFSKGLSFIGLNPKGWFDAYGEISLPFGLWLLFFSLFLCISEQSIDRSKKVALSYTFFLSLALLTSFLWEWYLPLGWSNTVILVSMLTYFVLQWVPIFFRVKLFLISFIGCIHGLVGLSLLPAIPQYFGTTSLFAAFQVGAVLGLGCGVLMLLPCVRWLHHALPYKRNNRLGIRFVIFLASALALLL